MAKFILQTATVHPARPRQHVYVVHEPKGADKNDRRPHGQIVNLETGLAMRARMPPVSQCPATPRSVQVSMPLLGGIMKT